MFRTRWALAALLAGCVLGGCNDDDPEPKVEPTPSASSSDNSPSASPSISPTETTKPSEPADTVMAWVAAWNEALQTGITTTLHSYETPDCRNCADLSSVIEEVTSAGGSFKGGAWSIASSKVLPIDEHRVKVNVAMEVAAGSTINRAGEDPVHFAADKRIVVYELEESSGGWLIDVIELLS